MRRIICSLTLVIALAGLAAASALAAGGKGSQTLSATCTTSGGVTVHASNGQSAWVNNTHWVVLKFTGTFTPTGGTSQTFTKVYGQKGLMLKGGFIRKTQQSCTGSTSDSTGMFVFTAWVAKTPH
jgi:hypothetical protein